jgi:hypothetical protein
LDQGASLGIPYSVKKTGESAIFKSNYNIRTA